MCLMMTWFIFGCRYWTSNEEGHIIWYFVPNDLSLFVRCQPSSAFLNIDLNLLILRHAWYTVRVGFINLDSFFLSSIFIVDLYP